MSGWGLVGVIPALGIDTFVSAAAIGTNGWRVARPIAVATALSEGVMPIVGALLGAAFDRLVAERALWGAACLLAMLGIFELRDGWRDLTGLGRTPEDEGGRGPRGLLGLVGLGISVSLDELGVGVGTGVVGMPLEILAPALAAQAVLFTLLGLAAGGRLRRLSGRYGNLAAGAALLALAPALLLFARVGT